MAEWQDVAWEALKVGYSYNLRKQGGSRFRTMALVAMPEADLAVFSLVTHKGGKQRLGALQLVERSQVEGLQTVGKSHGGQESKAWKVTPALMAKAQEAVSRWQSEQEQETAETA